MTRVPFVCSPDQHELCEGMAQIRDELEIRAHFSDAVVAEARSSAQAGPQIPPGSGGATVVDRTDLDFVTIDPPGSMDLDQAYAGEQTTNGWRVYYAIADVAAWVAPGSLIDAESQARGFTMYSPDTRAPLHPAELSEAAASLLPDADRQALLWTIDLDDSGEITQAQLERAVVRSRAKLTYREASAGIERGDNPVLNSLREIGLRREALEVERGAVSLNLASQEVVTTEAGFDLVYDESLPVEGWNAQISLLTGIAAASIMLEGGVGLLRTLPRPRKRTIRELQVVARALDVDWPDSASYADIVRNLDPNDPQQAALIAQSARGLRGAGYVAFDGEIPELTEHSAIAANYAHVTAPLRRLGDRYANECVLAISAGTRPPEWVLEALPELPSMLGRARNKEGALERSIVDLVEAALLSNSVGRTFQGLITNVDDDKNRVRVQLKDPAVVAYADGVGELGDVAHVRLTEADVAKRRVRFELTGG